MNDNDGNCFTILRTKFDDDNADDADNDDYDDAEFTVCGFILS